MVTSLKAALVLSLLFIIGQNALAAGSGSTALIAYLETTEGGARFEALISSSNKLMEIQNFIRGRGGRDAEIATALKASGAERAYKLRALMEEALARSASDPAFSSRVAKAAKEVLGVTDADLNRVAALQLPTNGALTPAGRAALIRGGGNVMPGGKFGPPMPKGFKNPQAVAAKLEELAQLERAEGGVLPDGFEEALRIDEEAVPEGLFDSCLKGDDGKPLAKGQRHVLEVMIASRAKVPAHLRGRELDIAATEAMIDAGIEARERTVDREEEIDSVETLATQCGLVGERYARGIALIRAGI